MVQMNDVRKIYDSSGTLALDGVDLTINEGEFVFLVGPSGSGKTTIIKLLTGEIQPTEGTVIVNDFDLGKLKRRKLPKMRRTLGIIFQDFRLIDNMNVYDNVAFAMRVVGASAKEIKKRVPYVLELVGLEGREKRLPQELSGGEQQRVAIARALGMDTKILLADEPTGNLDTANSDNIFRILQQLAHEGGYCVIIVTHDMGIAARADRVLELNADSAPFAALKKALDAGDKDTVSKYSTLLYDQALLMAGLPLEDPAGFAQMVASLMV